MLQNKANVSFIMDAGISDVGYVGVNYYDDHLNEHRLSRLEILQEWNRRLVATIISTEYKQVKSVILCTGYQVRALGQLSLVEY